MNRIEWLIFFAGILLLSSNLSCKTEDSLAPQLQKVVEARKQAEGNKKIVLGEKGEQRRREIELLVNIIAPDPEYQPWYLADEADLFAVRDQGERILRPRLEGYFGNPLKFEIKKRQPLWEWSMTSRNAIRIGQMDGIALKRLRLKTARAILAGAGLRLESDS
jgi:hypothetical protein